MSGRLASAPVAHRGKAGSGESSEPGDIGRGKRRSSTPFLGIFKLRARDVSVPVRRNLEIEMPKKKSAEQRPPKTKIGGKLALLKTCLNVVKLLTMLFSAINKLCDVLSKLIHHFS